MTTPVRPRGEFREAAAHLQYGGLSGNGDDSAWCKSMACLLDWVARTGTLRASGHRRQRPSSRCPRSPAGGTQPRS